MIKLGIFDEVKYAELFPNSPHAISSVSRGFGRYAQVWLDSRSIAEGTRDNYKSVLNVWWMPYLATPRCRTSPPHSCASWWCRFPGRRTG